MAINLGGFGNVIQQTTERPTYQADLTLGNAMQQFGQIAGQIAQKEKQKIDQAQSATKTAEFQIAAEELGAMAQENLRKGNLRPDEVETWVSDRLSDIKKDKLKGLNNDLKDRLTVGFDIAGMKYKAKAREMQAGFVKEGQMAELMKTREALERLALSDPNAAQAQWNQTLDTIGVDVLDQAQLQDQRQSFIETTTFNKVASDLEGMNGIAAVRSMEQKLADPNYLPNLAPERRLQLRNAAQSKRRELKAEADRIRREQESLQMEQAGMYANILGSGLPVSPELRGQIAAFTAQGGKGARAIKPVLENYDLIRQQQLQPLSEQGANLTKLRREVEAETDPKRRAELQTRFSVLSQSYQNGVKRFQQDPLLAYSESTAKPVPPIDLSSTDAFLGTLQERARYAKEAQGMYGRPVDLLTNVEAEQFAVTFKQMPVAMQADMLRSIKVAGGDSAAMSLAGAINKQDPQLGLAAYHAAKGGVTNNGRSTAAILLKGAKSQIKIEGANEKSLRQFFIGATGDAFVNNSLAFETYFEGVKLAYKAKSEEDNDMNGVYNSRRATEAVSIALGTKPIRIGGQDVIPPVGVGPERFKSVMETGIQNIGANVYKLKGRALDDFVKGTTLIPAANETYLLHNTETNADFLYPEGHKNAGQPIRLRGQ